MIRNYLISTKLGNNNMQSCWIILSYWMNIELLNKYEAIEWIYNYWVKTNKLSNIKFDFEYKWNFWS